MQSEKMSESASIDQFKIGMSFQKMNIQSTSIYDFGYPDETAFHVTVNNNQ